MKTPNNQKPAIGSKWIHPKYGIGRIIEDTENLCSSTEILFEPYNNENISTDLEDNKCQYDIVEITDLLPEFIKPIN